MERLILVLVFLGVVIGGFIQRNRNMRKVMEEEDQPARRAVVRGSEGLLDALNLMRLEVENARGGDAGRRVSVGASGGGVELHVESGDVDAEPGELAALEERMREVSSAWQRLDPGTQQALLQRGVAGQFLGTFHELPVPRTRDDRQAMLRGIEETLDRFTVL